MCRDVISSEVVWSEADQRSTTNKATYPSTSVKLPFNTKKATKHPRAEGPTDKATLPEVLCRYTLDTLETMPSCYVVPQPASTEAHSLSQSKKSKNENHSSEKLKRDTKECVLNLQISEGLSPSNLGGINAIELKLPMIDSSGDEKTEDVSTKRVKEGTQQNTFHDGLDFRETTKYGNNYSELVYDKQEKIGNCYERIHISGKESSDPLLKRQESFL